MSDQAGTATTADTAGERGPFPVGVTTIVIDAPHRELPLPVEVWYPADDAERGHDVDPDGGDEYDLIPGIATGTQQAVRDAEAAAPTDGKRFPLVVFSHGMAGHRRQSTFLCTHLASHGFVVAAPDHVGNTLNEMLPHFFAGDDDAIAGAMLQSALDRPGDVIATLDAVAARAGEWGATTDRVGLCGHSFGGWTVLQVTGQEPRVAAVVGLAPGGGRSANEEVAAAFLDLDWGREVPTLVIAADGDSVLPLDGVQELVPRIPGAVGLVVLTDADHYHFCDDSEAQHEMIRGLGMGGLGEMRPYNELMPAAEAEARIRSLARAHFEAVVRSAR